MREWRRRALGDDAPWAPTLIEVRGPTEEVRAWTGPSMGIHLSRFLGPVASWRVMQVLGELGAAAASERLGERPALGALARAVSRREFLKGAGGAVAGAAVLAGFGWVPLAANGRRSTAQAQTQGNGQGCDFREPAYSYGELTGLERDTVVINNYYYNPQFRVLFDTFYVNGFIPRPEAARVVTVTYTTTSGGSTRYAYDLRLPFEGVGQQYPVLGVTSNESVANTSMAVFQRPSSANQASRADIYRAVGPYSIAFMRSLQGPFPSADDAPRVARGSTPPASELIAPKASASEKKVASSREASAPEVSAPGATTPGRGARSKRSARKRSAPGGRTTPERTAPEEVTAPQVTASEAMASDATPPAPTGSASCEGYAKVVETIGASGCAYVAEAGCAIACLAGDRYVDYGGCEPQCGAAIAAVCAVGVPAEKDTACQPFCDHEELSGDELVNEARRAALSQDMTNVGPGASWSAGMQVGPASQSCTSGTGQNGCLTFICHDPAAGCDSHFDGNNRLVLAPGSTAIMGVRHKCSDGNTRLAISFLLSDDRVYHYWEYDQPENRTKTEAGRWEKDSADSTKLRRTKGSQNGKLDRPLSTRQTQGTVSTQQYSGDDCGGCSEDCTLGNE